MNPNVESSVLCNDIISWALIKNGLNWEMAPKSLSEPDTIRRALREMVQRFSKHYKHELIKMTRSVKLVPEKISSEFHELAEALFDDITWDRISAFFAFSAQLACRCAQIGNQIMIGNIVNLVTNICEVKLSSWIQSQGGWSTLVTINQYYKEIERKYRRKVFKELAIVSGAIICTGLALVYFIIGRNTVADV